MKKLLSLLVVMTLIVTTIQIPFNLKVSAAGYTVNDIQIKMVNSPGEDEQVDSLSEGSFYATANVTQPRLKKSILFFALYKNGKLVELSFKASTSKKIDGNVDVTTEQKPISISLKSGESITDYTAKVFVLESMATLKPLGNVYNISGFSKNNIYDNFSTVECENSAFEMNNGTLGRKFEDSDNLIVYPLSSNTPYGAIKYEGSNGKVAKGTENASTAYALYTGSFDGKYAYATFSYPEGGKYANHTDLINNFYKNNLKIYAGQTPDNLTQIPIKEWGGSNISNGIFVSAKTNKLPSGYNYVKFVITDFSSEHTVSSFRITDGSRNFKAQVLYDDYSYNQYDEVYDMRRRRINRTSEYGTLVYCLQPEDNATGPVGVGYAGDFGTASLTYLATFDDDFINNVLAPLHDSSYDRWGAWQDAVALADYEFFYSTDNGETLNKLSPDSYNFKRPGQYRALSVEINFDSLPIGTNYIFIQIGNPRWSTRIGYIRCWQDVEFNADGYPKDLDINNFKTNQIGVYSPGYTADVSGDTEVIVCAPNITSVKAYSWLPEGTYGSDSLVAETSLDAFGLGKFIINLDQYPYGPIVVRIKGYNGETMVDECHLQLYNLSGVKWNYGINEAPVNPVVTQNNLTQVFLDDFTSMPTISWNYGAKYSSHKIGYGDFSGIGFKDHDNNPKTPFSQRDSYFRIHARSEKDSNGREIGETGLIASMHQDRMHGFAVKAPAYFECRFIAQNAKGSWPAFWLMTTDYGSEGDNGNDEIDVIEAYGFDYSQPQGKNVNGYHATIHDWGNTVDWDNSSNDSGIPDMANMHSGGNWYTDFHTYAVYIGLDYTIYYCDNVEFYRHRTLPNSATKYHYWMFNYAFGGISGWPYDLTRYNNVSDMYVDWVRVYGLSQNVVSNY